MSTKSSKKPQSPKKSATAPETREDGGPAAEAAQSEQAPAGEPQEDLPPPMRTAVDLGQIYEAALTHSGKNLTLPADDVRHLVEALIVLSAQKQVFIEAVQKASAAPLEGLEELRARVKERADA